MQAPEMGLLDGLAALRRALAEVLTPSLVPALGAPGPAGSIGPRLDGLLTSDALSVGSPAGGGPAGGSPARGGPTSGRGAGDPRSPLADEAETTRLVALVELARGGDADAFGSLYDHYQPSVYRFVYYRVGSVAVAEDLTADTFFRALRSLGTFQWQGKDFGAWLTTIARNLTNDHFRAGRTRLERPTDDLTAYDGTVEGPESAVLASMTNAALLTALRRLPTEQQECLVMRFLQGLSIAETALALGRSEGAVKQLQLRAVRHLAKLLPEGLR
jgi:RNA polymerase sigma-70 factor (ECF subfamily)